MTSLLQKLDWEAANETVTEYQKQRGEYGKMCQAEDSHIHRDDIFKHKGVFILLLLNCLWDFFKKRKEASGN